MMYLEMTQINYMLGSFNDYSFCDTPSEESTYY